MVVRSQIGHHPRSTKQTNKQEAVMASKESPSGENYVTEEEAKDSLVAKSLDGFPIVNDVDPEAVARRMAKRVRGTKSMDELFDSLTGKSSDEMVGKSFRFLSVSWQPYESQRGPIPLAVCDVVDIATGEATEFVTTGAMLVQFLRQAELLNGFPFEARITQKVTNSGQKALNFERV